MNRDQIKMQIASENSLNNFSLNLIRQFDERLLTPTDINIEVQEPKNPNAITTVSYSEADKEVKFKVKTPWLSHWDNTKRIRVVAHQDVVSQMKADPNLSTLALKKENVVANSGKDPYTRYVIITPANIELSF